MKTLKKILLIGMLVIASATLFAQDPPLPNGGSDPDMDNDPVGGRASVSGGLIVMLALGAGYGAKKVYDLKFKHAE